MSHIKSCKLLNLQTSSNKSNVCGRIYLAAVAFRYRMIFSEISKSNNPFATKPLFLRVCSTCLLKTQWEKEKLLVTSNFSFSYSAFYPFEELSDTLIKFEIVVCKLFQFRRV